METLPELLVGGGLGTAAATALTMMVRSLRRAVDRLFTIVEKNAECLRNMESTIQRELHPNGGAPLAERVANIEIRLGQLER